jgi:pyocin large subunit-like protein
VLMGECLGDVVVPGNDVEYSNNDVERSWVEVLMPVGIIIGRTAASDTVNHKKTRTRTARHKEVIIKPQKQQRTRNRDSWVILQEIQSAHIPTSSTMST